MKFGGHRWRIRTSPPAPARSSGVQTDGSHPRAASARASDRFTLANECVPTRSPSRSSRSEGDMRAWASATRDMLQNPRPAPTYASGSSPTGVIRRDNGKASFGAKNVGGLNPKGTGGWNRDRGADDDDVQQRRCGNSRDVESNRAEYDGSNHAARGDRGNDANHQAGNRPRHCRHPSNRRTCRRRRADGAAQRHFFRPVAP